MSTINFGNIVGNRIVGLSSGLDTEALIKGLSEAKQKPITALNDKITLNNSKASKFGDLKTLLTNLKSAANYLKNPFGINTQFSNIFEYRTAKLSSSSLTSSSYLSVTANPGALKGTTSIEIGQLATALEKRSGSFNSRNTSATTAATGSYFNAGTFQIGSAVVNQQDGATKTGFTLASGDYSVVGAGTGVLTSAGIHDITVTGGSGGETLLQGRLSGFAGTLGAGTTTFTVVKNGVTYTSNAVDVTQSVNGGANLGIASGTVITFTADSGGVNETSFQITTASDVTVDDTQSNITSFASNLDTALSGQSIFQSRQLQNFTDANVKPPLTGLTNSNIRFISNAYGATGGIGKIDGFTVEYGAGNTSAISVDINGETFRATGLGNTLNTNITLQSTTTDKQIEINLGDAAVSAALGNATDATSLERSLDYAFGTRALVDVTVTAGQTLNDVIFNINSKATQTGASAAITKVSDFDYRFSLKANNAGVDNSYDIYDGSGVLTNVALDPTQSAQDSKIRIDGVELTRSSNSITDAIEDVTLDLLAVTPNYGDLTPDSINVTVDNDVDTVVDKVVSFLDAYNAVRVFITEQNQRDPLTSKFTEDAILGGDTALQTLTNQLLAEINNVVGNTSDVNFDALTDIGITLSDFAGDGTTVGTKNILIFDETTLRDKLANNYDKLREIFEFKYSSSSTSLSFLKSSNNFTLNDFKLDIDTSRAVGEQVKLLNADGTDYLDDNNELVYLTAAGTKISGKTGTPVDGLEFIYTGDGTDVISVSLSQGIADKVFNLTDSYVKTDGTIDTTLENISQNNDDSQTDITRLQDQLDKYVERLRNQFAALESAISSVNNILSLLDANSAAANKNN